VDDLVEGIYRLHFSNETRPVNIGNPDEITISDFAEEIIALTGTEQKVVYRDLPENDPMQRQPDIGRAQSVLGWEPTIDRAEGLKRTYAYFKTLTTEQLHKSEHREFSKYNKD
jgi:dTDP-glucose 4,6-dehydratase